MAVSANSWANAEGNVLAWISSVVEGTDVGRNLFIGEIPPGVYDAISFAITGPSGSSFVAECATRNMTAEIVARYESRVDAQEVEHQVADGLPITTIDDVPRVAQLAEASIVREILSEGRQNPVRVWTVTIPLMVAFNAIT